MGSIIYWDNGKENGNYYLGFRVLGGVRVQGFRGWNFSLRFWTSCLGCGSCFLILEI